MYDYLRCASPLGMLTVAAEGEKLTALVIDGQKYAEKHLSGEGHERETPVLLKVRNWLNQYFKGKNPDVRVFSLAPKGTKFQQRVWEELLNISYGQTATYGEIAVVLGSSARAVGAAVGRNPLSILVPCHRVLAAGGALTGYAGGLENKEKLLKLEALL